MDEASKQALLSALRSILIVIGGTFTARGIMSSEMVDQIVGAMMVILPAAWGIWQKFSAEKKAKAREAIAVNIGIAVADRTPGLTPAVAAINAPEVIEAFAPVAPITTVAISPMERGILPTDSVLPQR